MAGITCTVHRLRHGGCDKASEPRARPELQHGASLEEVPLEQDVVSQEQGTPPHLEGEGQGRTGNVRLGTDPSGPQEVDGTYPPASQHPPGAWPWCVLDRTETKRERATVKMGTDRTQTDRTHGNLHTQRALESGVTREAETQAVLPVRRGQLGVTRRPGSGAHSLG